jgi:drug/metabolite transporter (DMT)-like permease
VFLWGFTAILGKYITLNEVILVWYRTLFTAIIFLFVPIFWKEIKKTSFKSLLIFGGIGGLVAIHWFLFYGSIKYSNASIGVACVGTTALITALIEPLMSKNKLKTIDLLFGILVIPGIWLISNASPIGYRNGIIMGIFSALIAAIFTILNKQKTTKNNPVVVSWAQMLGGFLFTCLIMPIYLNFFPNTLKIPSYSDLSNLIILSIFCTALPYILSIWAFRHISAFNWIFIVNMEPLYGIILAIILLKENTELGINFYIGASLIFLSVIGKFLFEKWYLNKNRI